MSDTPTADATTSRAVDQQLSINQPVKGVIRARIDRAANYVSIYAFVLVVYGGAVVTDYLLFALVSFLLTEDVKKYPIVALAFDYARIGLALLVIIVAVIHGAIATISQIRLDWELAREDRRK